MEFQQRIWTPAYEFCWVARAKLQRQVQGSRIALRKNIFFLSGSAGPAFCTITDRCEGFGTDYFPGIALQSELLLLPSDSFGIGICLFGDINTDTPIGGATLTLVFGIVRDE